MGDAKDKPKEWGKDAFDPFDITGGVSDVWNDISGVTAQAEAAQAAAEAQMAEARRQQEQAIDLAEATPQELQAYDQVLSSAEENLQRRERQIAAIDPAIMEASEQVLALLQGEEAGSTQAAMQQRQRQRQQLVDTLRQQYGPGAETSSIGQQALQRFDEQTNMLTQQSQRQALSDVFNIAGNAQGLASTNSAMAGLTAAGQNFSNIQGRLVGAATGTGAPVIQTAGGQFVGDQIKAQGQQQLFNTALNAGAAYATGGMSMAMPGGGPAGGSGGMGGGQQRNPYSQTGGGYGWGGA